MTGMFSKPKMPEVQTAAPDPAKTAAEVNTAQEAEIRRGKTRKGRGATILTGGAGVVADDTAGAGTKKLLG